MPPRSPHVAAIPTADYRCADAWLSQHPADRELSNRRFEAAAIGRKPSRTAEQRAPHTGSRRLR